jgi:hypothetical protein
MFLIWIGDSTHNTDAYLCYGWFMKYGVPGTHFTLGAQTSLFTIKNRKGNKQKEAMAR